MYLDVLAKERAQCFKESSKDMMEYLSTYNDAKEDESIEPSGHTDSELDSDSGSDSDSDFDFGYGSDTSTEKFRRTKKNACTCNYWLRQSTCERLSEPYAYKTLKCQRRLTDGKSCMKPI
jgi:hypothetical protein